MRLFGRLENQVPEQMAVARCSLVVGLARKGAAAWVIGAHFESGEWRE